MFDQIANSQLMQCPACGSPLEAVQIQDIEIDQCPQCRGVWFDHIEIDEILAIPKLPARLTSQELYRDPPELIPEGERSCPRCSESLKTIHVDDVTLDACASCKGFFADIGEVDRLAAASEQRYQASTQDESGE